MDRSLAVTCDVRNREEIDRLLGLTVHNFGRCDIWVNNAGHGLVDTIEKLDQQQCRELFETNFWGSLAGMQSAIAYMRGQGSGTVINISSVAGYITMPGSSAYGATKSALTAIGKAADLELRGSGVHVMTVCPGFIATNFIANSVQGNEPRRFGGRRRGASAEEVAKATLEGYLKHKQVVIVPWYYHILIKVHQLFPSLLDNYMAGHLQPVPKSAANPALVERDSSGKF
jgi:short-subunit dehydrogenase